MADEIDLVARPRPSKMLRHNLLDPSPSLNKIGSHKDEVRLESMRALYQQVWPTSQELPSPFGFAHRLTEYGTKACN